MWLPKSFDTFGKFPFAAVTGIPVKYFKPVRKIKAECEYRWVGIDRNKGIISLPGWRRKKNLNTFLMSD